MSHGGCRHVLCASSLRCFAVLHMIGSCEAAAELRTKHRKQTSTSALPQTAPCQFAQPITAAIEPEKIQDDLR